MLARFLRDLGVDGRDIPVDEAERAARYRTILAGRRMLVVLDNARDAAQVRPLLPGTASCAVLVTTRSRMPDLASTKLVDLNVLDDEEALTLFTRVVGDERAAAEPEATAELLLACAGLPLAIRICAARLATRSGWTIQAMANRLRDEHRRLDEMSVGDLAVRASFQVSFASLPASAQPDGIAPADAFRLLGLWHGPSISSAAAAALFGTPEYLAADALEVLVDAHLLESTAPDRYKFHDLLRVYSSERAVADLSGQTATPRSAACSAGTCAPPTRPPRPSRRIATTCRWTTPKTPIRRRSASPAPRTPSPGMTASAPTWSPPPVRPPRPACTRSPGGCPPPCSVVFNSRGNWADCIATHRIALESARQAGNRQGEAWVLNNLGDALGSPAIAKASVTWSRRSRSGARSATGWGEAQAANNLADAYSASGRTDEALDLLRRALDLNREVGNRYGEGVALVNLGAALLDLDRAEEAIDYLLQARRTFAEIDYADGDGLRPAHPRALLPVAGTRRGGPGLPAAGPEQPPGYG